MINSNIKEELSKELFKIREEENKHLTYAEEMSIYSLIKKGEPDKLIPYFKDFYSDKVGVLSLDPVRNKKYLFICTTTITSRMAIEGGLENEKALLLSDLYIRKVDLLTTIEDIYDLYCQMLTDFATSVEQVNHRKSISKITYDALNYIQNNLHNKISLTSLAEYLYISPSYFQSLFKKEMNITIGDYIRKSRVEAACDLLHYSDYSIAEISQYLCFNSQSHFSHVFKEYMNETPYSYRKRLENSKFSNTL